MLHILPQLQMSNEYAYFHQQRDQGQPNNQEDQSSSISNNNTSSNTIYDNRFSPSQLPLSVQQQLQLQQQQQQFQQTIQPQSSNYMMQVQPNYLFPSQSVNDGTYTSNVDYQISSMVPQTQPHFLQQNQQAQGQSTGVSIIPSRYSSIDDIQRREVAALNYQNYSNTSNNNSNSSSQFFNPQPPPFIGIPSSSSVSSTYFTQQGHSPSHGSPHDSPRIQQRSQSMLPPQYYGSQQMIIAKYPIDSYEFQQQQQAQSQAQTQQQHQQQQQFLYHQQLHLQQLQHQQHQAQHSLQHKRKYKLWSEEEDQRLLDLKRNKLLSWKDIATKFSDRTLHACQFRWRKISPYITEDNKININRDEDGIEVFDEEVIENIDGSIDGSVVDTNDFKENNTGGTNSPTSGQVVQDGPLKVNLEDSRSRTPMEEMEHRRTFSVEDGNQSSSGGIINDNSKHRDMKIRNILN